MYLRFITQFINENNQTETGFFNAIEFLELNPLTKDEDIVRLKFLHNWFRNNLSAPPWFKKPTGKSYEAKSLSWFKDTAKQHILNANEAIEILGKYDILVERISIKNPGYIEYEDEYQVSAVPFKTHAKKVI